MPGDDTNVDRVSREELYGRGGGGLDMDGGYAQFIRVPELLRRLAVWVQDSGVWGAEILGLGRFGQHEGWPCWRHGHVPVVFRLSVSREITDEAGFKAKEWGKRVPSARPP